MKTIFLIVLGITMAQSAMAAKILLSTNDIQVLKYTGSLVFCDGDGWTNSGKAEAANKALFEAVEASKPKRVTISNLALNSNGNFCMTLKAD